MQRPWVPASNRGGGGGQKRKKFVKFSGDGEPASQPLHFRDFLPAKQVHKEGKRRQRDVDLSLFS